VLWGSNAREAHPIMFHHMLRGRRNGARMIVVDPRRSASSTFADLWLGLDVGTDIALAHTVAREIIVSGLHHERFIAAATTGFEVYREAVEPWTLELGEKVTGVPAEAIRELAHAYATAERAIICWTLGITEHVTGVDNVFALIDLALLTGHVGRYGSGLAPLRGQNNVQGGGDMGALPNRLPGFHDLVDDAARARFEAVWGTPIPADPGWHLSQMFEAMEHGDLRALYVIGENPADSEADGVKARRLLAGLDCLVVQDIHLTRTAELADVVLPAAASFAETTGTVTNSERRVQLVRAAVPPPGEARDDLAIVYALAAALGHDWGRPEAEQVWDELRSLSPQHLGMSYARLEEHGGLRWPCRTLEDPGALFLHGRLWADPCEGPRAPFQPVRWQPPIDELTDEFPLRLTTGRRLDSYNTGVQTGGYDSPKRRSETLDLSPVDAAALGVAEGERVRVVSRRGAVEAPVRVDPGLVAGLAFMTFHFPDQVDTNVLVSDAWDPKSGTAEFKATAVRVERLSALVETQ
jgi:predicted molibdopterin-dependent oxidoreductase YjgC